MGRGRGKGKGYDQHGNTNTWNRRSNSQQNRYFQRQEAPREESLSSQARKICTQYEETRTIELLDDLRAVVEQFEEGEEAPDVKYLGQVLSTLCRLHVDACQRLCEVVNNHGLKIDIATASAVIVAIPQRSQDLAVIAFIDAISKILEHTPDEQSFFSRHASYALAELLTEAQETINKAENWQPAALTASGLMEELYIETKKPATVTGCSLYNMQQPGTNNLVYHPSGQPAAFAKSDTALMRLADIPPGKNYHPIRDSAEVEVTSANANSAVAIKFLGSPPRFYDEMKDKMWRLDKLGNRDQMRRIVDAAKVMLTTESRKTDAKRPPAQPNPLLLRLLVTPRHKKVSEDDWAEELISLQQRSAIYEEADRLRTMDRLNESQADALTHAASARLTLIQGPPGTGKTTTAVQIIVAMVLNEMCPLPILVSADSNTAVDNLVKGVAKEGVKVMRCGRLDSMREEVRKYALEGHWGELKRAEVICATCIGSGGDALDRMRFHTVLIDECTQASESSTLVPIACGCQQLILIGDQCQLPPTVLSQYAQREGLGDSLFHRLVQQGVTPSLLDTQYRMHPYICEFASASFYNSRLRTGISHVKRPPLEGFPWPVRSIPVCFIPMDKSVEAREGTSYTNSAEAEKVIWVLLQLQVGTALPVEQAGVVTPYIGQVNFIRKMLRERPNCAPFKTIEVSSVDGFQGREKDAIIFSAVRANKLGKVGFLDDWRRLNVMLTRAKRAMIVIGNRPTLSYDALWKHWLTWAQARGTVLGESARGKWTPKYLVDGTYGMVVTDLENAPEVVVEEKKVEVVVGLKEPAWEEVDDWEDIE
eukprot:GEMP01022787.1.p1 GENE.GEMP01022787.1~~GEMP01022787.1.p1  ORF type:complete len:834 (+),score=138.32 GEMP01022787.1:39-2504(+)